MRVAGSGVSAGFEKIRFWGARLVVGTEHGGDRLFGMWAAMGRACFWGGGSI